MEDYQIRCFDTLVSSKGEAYCDPYPGAVNDYITEQGMYIVSVNPLPDFLFFTFISVAFLLAVYYFSKEAIKDLKTLSHYENRVDRFRE
jgi:hypothetical protein